MYVAFLRGINIGSKNKISMAELKLLFESLELTQVKTLLNSGNIVFESNINEIKVLDKKSKHYGLSCSKTYRKKR